MKYTKLIVAFIFLNLLLVFSMIFIANKTREIEKSNINLKNEILKINEHIKINKIELTTHQNNSYLRKLYSLYFSDSKKNNLSKIVSIKQISDNESNIKLVKTKN